MPDADVETEALRQLEICHACRYCEGYCDVFSALGGLALIETDDLAHLANICHDCRACYQACMYTDPHEFAVNIPLVFSAVRADVYEEYAPPRVLSRLLRRGPVGALVLMALGAVAIVLMVGTWRGFQQLGHGRHGAGAFYEVIPSWLMTWAGLFAGVVSLTLLVLGQIEYWRAVYPRAVPWRDGSALLRALGRAASLAAMRGGGDGCYYPRADSPSGVRRWLHSLTAYGFLATFAATGAAAVYQHLLGKLPPYRFWTVPVVLGTGGGAMLLVGVIGLLYMKPSSGRTLGDTRGRRLEYAFLVTLLLLAVTGLLLLTLRSTDLMPTLLCVHLAVVGAFFLTAPYGKLVHAAFHFSAILKDELDRESDRQKRSSDPHPQDGFFLPTEPDSSIRPDSADGFAV